jgi:hypothetical protein
MQATVPLPCATGCYILNTVCIMMVPHYYNQLYVFVAVDSCYVDKMTGSFSSNYSVLWKYESALRSTKSKSY